MDTERERDREAGVREAAPCRLKPVWRNKYEGGGKGVRPMGDACAVVATCFACVKSIFAVIYCVYC